ncbi:MAG: hypothetical protein IJW74_00535 [Oscillospiraceae bacterium]|nr:hypothetical protein [Oscillospiraceae bacterium]
MKKGLKILLSVAAVFAFIVALLILSPKIIKTHSKNAAFKQVQNNQTELAEIANSVINGETDTPYEYKGYKVKHLKTPSVKEPIVEFNGRGFGIAPSGYYTGFYYSPKDIPVRFQGSGTAMEPSGNGWAYNEVGDNHGYTEKI